MDPRSTARTIRVLLLFEAATFLLASLIHSGVVIDGYQHRQARIGEGVIGVVLSCGAAAIWIRAVGVRRGGVAAQGFALLGTLIAVFTIVLPAAWKGITVRHLLTHTRQVLRRRPPGAHLQATGHDLHQDHQRSGHRPQPEQRLPAGRRPA